MKICYFGIYDPNFGRNKVYISGLRELGHEVIECRDRSAGLAKFWRLWRKHADIMRRSGAGGVGSERRVAAERPYDAMIVGYPGHVVVLFAKLISKAPVVFDALSTLYEGEVISRGRYKNNFFAQAKIRAIDFLAAKSADMILVETNAQREYFIKKFSLAPGKVVRVFTGADTETYFPDAAVGKRPKFSAVFRGKFLPEAGVEYIFGAAKILENQGVNFLILGHGFLEKKITELASDIKLKNLELVTRFLPADELRKKMLSCHVSLGQFGRHKRLERTIPHKAFESLAMSLPYLTGRARGISELLTDGRDALFANYADSEDLAAKLLQLKNNPELLKNISQNGRRLFEERLVPKKLAENIIETFRSL